MPETDQVWQVVFLFGSVPRGAGPFDAPDA